MSASGDAFKGFEIWWNNVRMNLKMHQKIVGVCLAVQFAIFAGAFFLFTPSEVSAIVCKYWFAKISSIMSSDPAISITLHQKVYDLGAYDLIASNVVQGIVSGAQPAIWFARVLSLAAWIIYPLMLRGFKKVADKHTQIIHIRGPELIEPEALLKQILSEKVETNLPMGIIPIPKKYEAEHFYFSGKTQVGKTTALLPIIDRVRSNGQKAIIADFKGEFVRKFYDAKRDIILNPLDTRCPGWSLRNEIKTKMSITGIVQSLIPPNTGEDRFWATAAQHVFSGLLTYAMVSGKNSNADIWALINLPIKDMAAILKTTPGGEAGHSYLRDCGKQAESVIAVMTSHVSWLEYSAEDDGPFCITDWLDSEEGGFIYLVSLPDIVTTLAPMYSLFIDLMGKQLLSRPDQHDNKVYFFLDEFGNLQKLPTIKSLLTAGASKGAVILLLCQDLAAVQKIYGKEDATTIFNSCGTTLMLNLVDPDTAKFFSDRIGKRQYWECNQTQSMGVEENRDGLSLTRQKITEELILPSEILNLPKYHGYLKLPEHNPSLINIPYLPICKEKGTIAEFSCRPGFSIPDLKIKGEAIFAAAKFAKKELIKAGLEAESELSAEMKTTLQQQLQQQKLSEQELETDVETAPVALFDMEMR